MIFCIRSYTHLTEVSFTCYNIFNDKNSRKQLTCFSKICMADSLIHCVKSGQIRSFFWPAFSCIWTEHRDLLRKSPHSVRIQENADQKKLRNWTLFTQWLCFEPQKFKAKDWMRCVRKVMQLIIYGEFRVWLVDKQNIGNQTSFS